MNTEQYAKFKDRVVAEAKAAKDAVDIIEDLGLSTQTLMRTEGNKIEVSSHEKAFAFVDKPHFAKTYGEMLAREDALADVLQWIEDIENNTAGESPAIRYTGRNGCDVILFTGASEGEEPLGGEKITLTFPFGTVVVPKNSYITRGGTAVSLIESASAR